MSLQMIAHQYMTSYQIQTLDSFVGSQNLGEDLIKISSIISR